MDIKRTHKKKIIAIIILSIVCLGLYFLQKSPEKVVKRIIEEEAILPAAFYYQQTQGVKNFCQENDFELQRYPEVYKKHFSEQYAEISEIYQKKYGIDLATIIKEYERQQGEKIKQVMEKEFSRIRAFLLHHMVRVNITDEETGSDSEWKPEYDNILSYKEICQELDNSKGDEKFFSIFENEINTFIELQKED